MKTKALFFVLSFFLIPLSLFAQVPQQFSYQAVVRNDGSILKDATVDVRLSILQDSENGSVIWSETQTITTNEYGLFSIEVGSMTPLDVDWSAGPYFLKAEVDINDGSGFTHMGTSRILSVPYALEAGAVGRLEKLNVQGTTLETDSALFEVKRKDGQTVFAVYNDSIRMYVNATETVKGRRGGFAIGGFDANKGTGPDYLRVTPDSVRIYIDPTDNKGRRGGFAIGGYDASKGITQEYLRVTDDSTRVYFDTIPGKGQRGGFAIGGYGASKGTGKSYFDVSGLTSVEKIEGENRIIWYPRKNAFLAGKILIEDPDSVGTNSFSAGFETKATGNWSQALGYQSIARGDYSTAIGKNATAQNENAVSIGNHSRADAVSSFAFGTGAISLGVNSYAIGSAGVDSAGYPTGNTFSRGEQSFAIGMGAESNGFGSFSVGTESKSDGNFSLSMGYKSYSNGYYSTAIGKDARATEDNAVAIGGGAWALADYAVTLGQGNTTAKRAISIGMGSAENLCSICIGGYYKLEEVAPLSWVFARHDSKATGDGSIAVGHGIESTKAFSTAMGYYAKALNDYASAFGYWAAAWAPYSMALGIESGAGGRYTTTLGYNTTAQALASTVVGTNNIISGSASSWVDTDPIFVVGNGSSSPSNAMTILKNGNTGIGNSSPGYRLQVYANAPGSYAMRIQNDGNSYTSHGIKIGCGADGTSSGTTYAISFVDGDGGWVGSISIKDHTVHYNTTSDRRLKTGITATQLNGIDIIQQIPVVDFAFRDLPQKTITGFIAQDVAKVYPDAVIQDEKGLYQLSYPSLVPILTKAVQEQQQIIEEQKAINKALMKKIDEIEKKLEKMEGMVMQ